MADDTPLPIPKPTKLICGYRDDIDTAARRLVDKPTPIQMAVTITVRGWGTCTYIALGNEDEQPFLLTGINQSIDIDFIDDLSKIVVRGDGTGGHLQWIGG